MPIAVPNQQVEPDARSEEYVTVPQAARLLRVSTPTVWRWITAAKLPALRVGERSVRVKRSDLNRVMSSAREGKVVTEVVGRQRATILTGPRGPLDAREVRKRLTALKQADATRAEQLARRGGKPYSSSTELVDQTREELSQRR